MTWTNLEDVISEISQSQKGQRFHFARFHLYEVSKIVALIEAESGMVAAKGWEVGNYRITSYRV